MVQIVAKEVKAANVGVDIQVYPGASLFKPNDQWNATANGQLDITLFPLDYASGKVGALKGKSADGSTAFAFYTMYELTGDKKYRAAALELAARGVVTGSDRRNRDYVGDALVVDGAGEPQLRLACDPQTAEIGRAHV